MKIIDFDRPMNSGGSCFPGFTRWTVSPCTEWRGVRRHRQRLGLGRLVGTRGYNMFQHCYDCPVELVDLGGHLSVCLFCSMGMIEKVA